MNKYNFLIVDDILMNRILLKEILIKITNQLAEAGNRKDALEILKNKSIDIVLMDIEMPVMNGLETTKYIRNNFPSPLNKIPIVALTAHNPDDFFDNCNSAGFDDLLTKPYSLIKVLGAIKNAKSYKQLLIIKIFTVMNRFKNIHRILTLFIGFTILLTSCKRTPSELLEPGVTIKLAKLRNEQLKNIKYNVSFTIPDSIQNKITGSVSIEFDYSKHTNEPLILDFRNESSFIKSVKTDGQKINYQFRNEHIIIPVKYLKQGKNKLEIDFIAGERALNRNEEYLYTLFVPDRACTAFPCFDQPSLKATFKPTITIPDNWIAVANSRLTKSESNKSNKTFYFAETEPISTYLFSFVAGEFQSVSQKKDGREITMYHRENDTAKINRNTDEIFDLKFGALKWLEEYTQINYPFTKLDFIIIPSFQYSGMEHPGAVLYRDSKLFLDESATIRDELSRANLIAHETAHMWFGDLVTMEWFSEVWLKEVFANFMADKIVNPQFPDINHNLNFLINHYPPSYSIDRTKGANPISQELDNMKNAGTIYGPIIYHKAPIMMNHLEQLTGDKILQEGLQEYLEAYKYGNATWDNLINILNNKTDIDLMNWSKVWVYEPGMPYFIAQKAFNPDNQLSTIIIEQRDPMEKGRIWIQNLKTVLSYQNEFNTYHTEAQDTFTIINLNKPLPSVNYIFTNADGLGYGYFKLDKESKKYLLKNINSLNDKVLRCALYINLWENMLNEQIKPAILLESFLKALNHETDDQNINLLLNYIQSIFWKFLTSEERQNLSPIIEDTLWTKLKNGTQERAQSSFFKTYSKIAINDAAINNLTQIFNDQKDIKGLQLSTRDFTDLGFELALRNVKSTGEILNTQYKRIENEERKNRFNFIKPSLSNNEQERDQFFNSLLDEKNREKEPWVVTALYYLHHPLRSKSAVKYLRPSLDILEELQVTGDIFFPAQWLDATFSGHSSIDAMTEINVFLNENPNYPQNLKNKILQSTDLVFRANLIKKEY